MSLNLAKNNVHMTISGRGWNDEATDSGEGETEEGSALEDLVNDLEYDPVIDTDYNPENDPDYDPSEDPDLDVDYDLTYDFGDGFNWDVVAEDTDINLDMDGNIDTDQLETLTQTIADLAHDEDAIYNYMTDHSPSKGIPARIRVIRPPDKLEYSNGDEIDFTGIIVAAYASLTTRLPFIMEGAAGPHQNQIPFNQLTFPVTTLSLSEASKVMLGHLAVQDMMPFNIYDHIYFKKIATSSPVYTQSYIYDGGMIACFLNDEIHAVMIVYASKTASKNWFVNSRTDKTIDYDDAGSLSMTYTYNGKTVYYGYHETGLDSTKSEILAGGYNFSDRVTFDQTIDFPLSKYIAWSMMYGKIDSPETSIPVQWQTDYREEPYEASFDIQVT